MKNRTEDTIEDTMEFFGKSWQEAVNEKNWDSAILSGISAYIYFVGKKQNVPAQGALGLILAAAKLRDNEHGILVEKKCSFCGKDESQVRLGAGANALICESCVSMFNKVFLSEDKE